MSYTAIVILNYNNYEDTIKCIESIEEFNTANIKYFLVDNASTREGVVDKLSKFITENFSNNYIQLKSTDQVIGRYPRMTFIISDNNGGYAKGNNIGLRFAFGDEDIDNILIINNDVLFVEDIIPTLVLSTKKLHRCALVSPILYKKDMVDLDYCCARKDTSFRQIIMTSLILGKPWFGIKEKIDNENFILKSNPDFVNNDYVAIDLPSGSCMLASKNIWERLNGFDPNTFLYCEEAILFKKIEGLGLQNYLVPSLKCIHLGASSTSKSVSPRQTLLSFESKKYYLNTYVKLPFFKRLLLKCVLAYNELALNLKFNVLKMQNDSTRHRK